MDGKLKANVEIMYFFHLVTQSVLYCTVHIKKVITSKLVPQWAIRFPHFSLP